MNGGSKLERVGSGYESGTAAAEGVSKSRVKGLG